MNHAVPRLVLFFTRDVSLATWNKQGMFDREVGVYKELAGKGFDVTFVTYGDRSDLQYESAIPGIHVCCNRWNLPRAIYRVLLPCLHAGAMHGADLFKTNQTLGAQAALAAARLWRKPLIARCGYLRSDFVSREKGRLSRAARHARAVERAVWARADRIVVTTPQMREAVLQTVPEAADRVRVIPNYVDDTLFAPEQRASQDIDVLFVGRLHAQKNVDCLLEACREPAGPRVAIVGTGPLEAALKAKYANMGGNLSWEGSVPNNRLPNYLNRAKVFVLPSLYEGHPKTLLEAMACGRPVIGADSPGIRELIRHGETGWLCGTDASSIRLAVHSVLNDAGLRERMGNNARRFAVENFSLQKIATMELRLYRELAGPTAASSSGKADCGS